MMIKSFSVKNLNGRITREFHFHPDLNIITGPNGSGKTTILKLLWYLISANIERIPAEMSFDEVHLETDKYSLIISKAKGEKARTDLIYDVKYKIEGKSPNEKRLPWLQIEEEAPFVRQTNYQLASEGASIFFSTFRRIEGGFSTSGLRSRRRLRSSATRQFRESDSIQNPSLGLQLPLERYASLLSIGNHRFVASISTADLIDVLTAKYADISQTTNKYHGELSASIFEAIASYNSSYELSTLDKLQLAASAFEFIEQQVSKFNQIKNHLLNPFTTISDLVAQVFTHDGIRITDTIILGDRDKCVDSDHLSSGEKQMLSFLCYNAFTEHASIFIDEPELSLHVDWQRILFSILLSQKTSNQFIVTSHSPFIYTKFPDREIELS